MKIKVYFFGKLSEVTPWEKTYQQRINYRANLDLLALPQAGLKAVDKTKAKEAEAFLKKIGSTDFLIVLDERGQNFSSEAFSQTLKQALVDHRQVVLVVGGAHGLHASVLERANLKLAFGNMVWTRNLARLMLLEQLYRALEIDGGGRFHKA